MVGVAGRSGGCITCRKRRVKCDERKPWCERCAKANYTCAGYRRVTQFIDEKPRIEQNQLKKVRQSSHSTGCAEDLDVRELNSYSAPDASIFKRLHCRAFKDDIYTSFLLSHIFKGRDYLRDWIWICLRHDASPAAHASVMALSAVYFSRIHHEPFSLSKGFEWYGEAIKDLKADLANPKRATEVSVLASALALQTLEMFACDSERGWMRHAGGVAGLIQLRGPENHQSPEELSFFQSSRVLIAVRSLVLRKRCFLAEEKWKTVPWAKCRFGKTAGHRLHDILCDIPGLAEDAVLLRTQRPCHSKTNVLRQELSQKISNCLRSMLRWRAGWDDEYPNCSYEVVPGTNKLQAGKGTATPFTKAVYFSEFERANEYALFNSMLLALINIHTTVTKATIDVRSIAQSVPHITKNAALPLPSELSSKYQIAIEILRTVEYHILDDHESAGAYCVLFPLHIAYKEFEIDTTEAVWGKMVMQKLAETNGLEIGQKIVSHPVRTHEMAIAQ